MKYDRGIVAGTIPRMPLRLACICISGCEPVGVRAVVSRSGAAATAGPAVLAALFAGVAHSNWCILGAKSAGLVGGTGCRRPRPTVRLHAATGGCFLFSVFHASHQWHAVDQSRSLHTLKIHFDRIYDQRKNRDITITFRRALRAPRHKCDACGAPGCPEPDHTVQYSAITRQTRRGQRLCAPRVKVERRCTDLTERRTDCARRRVVTHTRGA